MALHVLLVHVYSDKVLVKGCQMTYYVGFVMSVLLTFCVKAQGCGNDEGMNIIMPWRAVS